MNELEIDTDGDKFWSTRYERIFYDQIGNVFARSVNKRLHRLNGPAADLTDGSRSYYIDNRQYSDYLEYLVAADGYRKKIN